MLFRDRTAVNGKINRDMRGHRGGLGERMDVGRFGVNRPRILIRILHVAQSLDSAGIRTRAKGDQHLGLPPDIADAFEIVLRSNRTLNQRHIVRTVEYKRTGFLEVANLQLAGDVEEFVFQV